MGAMAEARTLHCSQCGGTMTKGKKAPHILVQLAGFMSLVSGAILQFYWITLMAKAVLPGDPRVSLEIGRALGRGTLGGAVGVFFIFLGLKCCRRTLVWMCCNCGNFFDRA